jgi:hypothetical protein
MSLGHSEMTVQNSWNAKQRTPEHSKRGNGPQARDTTEFVSTTEDV